MGDRTGWLRDKVTRSLGVSESIFSELLERQGPDGKTYWESLNAFLDHEDTVESVVMFYTTEEVIGGTDGTPFVRRARLPRRGGTSHHTRCSRRRPPAIGHASVFCSRSAG